MKLILKNCGLVFQTKKELEITKRIRKTLTRFSSDSSQMGAVSQFIDTLYNAGLLSHISQLYMPWMASTAEQAFTNVVTGEKCTNISKWSIVDGKVFPSLEATTLEVFGVMLPRPVNTINFFGIIRDPKTDLDTVTTLAGFYGIDVGIGVYRYSSTSWISTGILQNIEGRGYGVNSDNSNSTVLFEIDSLSNLQNNSNTKVNGLPVSVSGSFDSSTVIGDEISKICPSSANIDNAAAAGFRTIMLIGDGTRLTSEQSSTLQTAMETLKTALNALEV